MIRTLALPHVLTARLTRRMKKTHVFGVLSLLRRDDGTRSRVRFLYLQSDARQLLEDKGLWEATQEVLDLISNDVRSCQVFNRSDACTITLPGFPNLRHLFLRSTNHGNFGVNFDLPFLSESNASLRELEVYGRILPSFGQKGPLPIFPNLKRIQYQSCTIDRTVDLSWKEMLAHSAQSVRILDFSIDRVHEHWKPAIELLHLFRDSVQELNIKFRVLTNRFDHVDPLPALPYLQRLQLWIIDRGGALEAIPISDIVPYMRQSTQLEDVEVIGSCTFYFPATQAQAANALPAKVLDFRRGGPVDHLSFRKLFAPYASLQTLRVHYRLFNRHGTRTGSHAHTANVLLELASSQYAPRLHVSLLVSGLAHLTHNMKANENLERMDACAAEVCATLSSLLHFRSVFLEADHLYLLDILGKAISSKARPNIKTLDLLCDLDSAAEASCDVQRVVKLVLGENLNAMPSLEGLSMYLSGIQYDDEQIYPLQAELASHGIRWTPWTEVDR
ncbi:hypothetical protein BT69DRAFT_1285949 [Atractiella rhizophila]|nr:hypothetical protein BT69DRAFT_1285949 [Atractiella rhizophila]